ncbi:MAG TPA: hypothetical protein VGK67_03085 [Myxococcales bacterium]
MEQIKIKGLSMVHLRRFLVERFGEDGLARVLAALPPDQARLLRSPAASEWYPLRDHALIEAKVMDVLYGGDLSKAKEFARFDAALQIGGIFKFFLRVLDPGFLIKKSASLWSQSFSGGRCEVETTGPHSCRMKLSGYDQVHEVMCSDWQGTLQGMLEVCGVKESVVTHPECRFHGQPHCLYEVSWKK